MVPRCAIGALALVITVGCSLEYGDARVAEQVPDSLPSAEIRDLSHTVIRNGRKLFSVEAEHALRFNRDNEQHLYNLSFEELDSGGEVLARGSAEFARYFDDSEDVEMEGEIAFDSVAENAIVRANYLYWNREQRLLYGAPDDLVHVEQEDGTSLSGYGFRADMRTRELSFDREVRGRYVEQGD